MSEETPPVAIPTEDSAVGQQAGQSDVLATYAGPYVTSMLGKSEAIANQPYQAYMGPLTAGPSTSAGAGVCRTS
jgi:hypothetical protein